MLVSRFPYQKIDRKTIGGRRLYSCPNGDKLPSVTTILGATKPEKDKQTLRNWKQRIGVANAQEITTAAANRGTRIHSFLEKYMLNGELGDSGSNPFSIQSHRMANHIVENGLKDITEFYGAEVNLYYPGLYAGTTDCVAMKNGQIIIGDFKQTNKPKKREYIEDYLLQLSAYISCHDKLYDTNIQCGIVMMCDPALTYQEWILEGEELEKYKQLWLDRVYQYYDSIL
jgi:genome maintenance exonuclease 1